MSGPIRVLVADDHPVVRAGVVGILSAEPDIEVAGEASSGDDAIAQAERLRPAIVLLDLSMPGPPPPATVRVLRERVEGARVIMLTAYHDRALVRTLIRAGIEGYVLKSDPPEAVIHAIRDVWEGKTWWSNEVVSGLAETQPVDRSRLTAREQELLDLLRQGSDPVDMAHRLNLREQTVRNYLHQLYGKLGVSSRAEALVWLQTHDTHGL